jgi:NAD(P)H-hydrate epimerase
MITAHSLFLSAAVREFDRIAIRQLGIPGAELMRKAAASAWAVLRARWPHARRIAVFCGPGNNGGDGYEVARLALSAGLAVDVWQLAPPTGVDASAMCAGFQAAGGAIRILPDDVGPLDDYAVLVDAIYGTGLSRAVPENVARAIRRIAAARGKGRGVIAIDIPSGLSADRGEILGAAVAADCTVTFVGNKLGLYLGAGPDRAGEVIFDALGLPDGVQGDQHPATDLLDEGDLAAALPPRARASFKNSNGHVLLVGGDVGTPGAILLAARGALRAGAGLVTVATRAAHAGALAAAQPELMVVGVESPADLEPLLKRATVLAIGPGLGDQHWGRSMWAALGDSAKPAVVDADALNQLAESPPATPLATLDRVLTPHPGEAARLLGCRGIDVQADRPAAAAELQRRYGGVAVLKGAGTLIQGLSLALCPYGNPGMGAGGMGDVLCGIIAGLRAQGLNAESAARTGVLAHALAGDDGARAGQRGMIPSDLIEALRSRINPR